METKIIRVADGESGGLKEVKVDAARWSAWDEWAKAEGRRVVGDVHPLTNRRVSGADAAEGLAFLTNELAYTESMIKIYYQPMQYDKALAGCIDTSAGAHVTSIEYDIMDQIGNAQDADSSAVDTPFTDVAYKRVTFGVSHAKVGYQFTQQEARTSAFLKRPLTTDRLQTAVDAYQRKLNADALLGNSLKNYTGLLNNASVTHAVTPSTTTWKAGGGTFAQILSDFQFGMHAVYSASGFNKVPTAVGLPPLAYEYMDVTPASATFPNKSILQYIRENNLCKSVLGRDLDIYSLFDAATAGASSSGRAVFYVREPDTMKFHITMPLQFLTPQLVDVYIKVPGEFRRSGVAVKRVTNVYYMDGVS